MQHCELGILPPPEGDQQESVAETIFWVSVCTLHCCDVAVLQPRTASAWDEFAHGDTLIQNGHMLEH